MPHGYDITREEREDGSVLLLGGVPLEVCGTILGETLAEAVVYAAPADQGATGKSAVPDAETDWRRVSTPLAWEKEKRWERVDLRWLAREPEPGSWERESPGGSVLAMRSRDGGRTVRLESGEPGLLRALLGGLLLQAFRAGEKSLPSVAIPDPVLDRVWDEAATGLHLNPNRKVLEETDLVLTGNLGREFHLGETGGRPEKVRTFRLVLDPSGEVRWEGPIEMPVRVYVREHLDSWPGCIAPVAIVVLAVVFVVLASWIGKACIGGLAGS